MKWSVPFVLFSISQAFGQQGEPPALATALWNASCAECHGKKADGVDGKHSLLGPELLYGAARGDDRRLFEVIRNGDEASGGAKHAFAGKLPDKSIWSLVVHLREEQAADQRKKLGLKTGYDEKTVRTSGGHSYAVERVNTKGLQIAWGLEFLPNALGTEWLCDGSMVITERAGTVRLLKDGVLSEPVAGTPAVVHNGQGGLMDVALHPEYARNGWVYLSFNKAKPDASGSGRGVPTMTSIIRGRIRSEGTGAYRWTDQETIFECKPEHCISSGLHFGCRIEFKKASDSDRYYVFWSIGDRGDNMNLGPSQAAQTLSRPNGKIHRLWDDGSVPDDNPFANVKDAYPSIWSYGHRNPQGLAFGIDGELWDTEHGPRGGDEFNHIIKGANYGWPIVCFGINYSDAAFVVPWAEFVGEGASGKQITMPADRWLPSIGACGLAVVRGPAFPKWEGDFVAGGLSGNNIDRIRVRDGKVVEREELLRPGRVRDVVVGPDGCVYVVLNTPEHIIRLVPRSGATP